jgi:hypothetical protein
MPIIPDNVQRGLKYWGNILAAAQSGATTQQLWDSIRASQQEYGLDTPGASASDIAVLRGYANRLMNSSVAYNSAAEDQAITADMMSMAPYTDRSAESVNTNPVYQVRFLNNIQLPDGSTVQSWQTSVFAAEDMPFTVGDLNSALQFNAQQLAQSGSESSSTTPKGTSLGVSSINISVV